MMDDPEPSSLVGYRSDRHRRSTSAQVLTAVLLVLVVIGGVIGVSRFLGDRQAAPPARGEGDQTTAQPGQRDEPGQATPPRSTAAGQGAGARSGSTEVPNLVDNPGFEGGRQLTGWQAAGALLERVQPGKDSDWAVAIRPDPGAPPPEAGRASDLIGMRAASVLRPTRKGSALLATAWVRALRPDTKARIVLVERAQGRTVTANAVTRPLYDTRWHAIAVNHRMRSTGASIDLEIGAVPGPDVAGLVVDGVGARVAQPVE
jgi:hypothetical protein